MPAIRDTSFAYESTTTDGGLTLPMCSYAAGDLMFAFAAGDTGAPTWGCSNGVGTWTQLFALSNTASLTCWWKYAAASGEGDVVLTSTVNETYSGCLVVVRDVFQGYTSGSPPLQANATATGTRIALPTLTTTTDNSLCLTAISGSATAPSVFFVEDALQDLVKADGTAEGMGVGWFFKRAAGLTTAYNAGCLVSGAGSKAVIEVRAPAGGATVLPAYPVSDASIFLSPTPGIAFDSNTAIAATADTNFGTSIAGKTCNDGTVATAVADIGLDTGAFMSFGGVTNATTANQMSGAEAVVASTRYSVGDRNVLCHFRHPTPANNQRLAPITSGRGVWFGMKSGATAAANWKVWQVHGGDVPLVPGYVQPIVISAANTDTIAANGTITNTDVRRYGFWTSGIGALTQQSCFGPMWAMDTTVLAGGVAAEPIGVPEIVKSAALGKVRFSSILQGANQMLCLQAIQFGNGGTDPVYLDLDTTAIEFPSKKNYGKKLVNYNGIDNAVGFTYYPGAGDTIKHTAAVVSSPSPFHWRIHASASVSANYDFTGLSIIGAGDVQLQPVTTFAGMSFTACPTVYTNGATVSACSFTNSTVYATSPASAALIGSSGFTKTTGTGHAMVISGTAANFTLSGVTFTGYAASNGSTGNEAIYVNIASGTVNITVSGGNAPSIRTAGATVNVISGATVTFTGLPTACDVVILTAGTSTILQQVDQNAGTSYAWAYSGTPTVDVGFIKPGYVPYYIRALALGSTDSSIPVALQADRNYV
jgi:hypothetical protein